MWLLGRWEVGRCSDTKEKALKPQNRKELGFVCVCVLGGEVVCFNVEEPKEGQMVLESKGERNSLEISQHSQAGQRSSALWGL